MTESDIKTYLDELARTMPRIVRSRLEKGDLVERATGIDYEIDDPEIVRMLGDFPEGTVPYGAIHRALTPRKPENKVAYFAELEKHGKQIHGKTVVPFSSVVKAGYGECAESALLVQLSAQRARDSYFINGCLAVKDNGISPIISHSYNVVFKDGVPHLVDAQNPLADSKPYIAPITGISGSDGEFQVPVEWKQGRTYTLI